MFHLDISEINIRATFNDGEAAPWQGCTHGKAYEILETSGQMSSDCPWFYFVSDSGIPRRSSSACFVPFNAATLLHVRIVALLKALGYTKGIFKVTMTDSGKFKIRKKS